MTSQSNEFQVTLPSNLKGNLRNTPVQYETTLAKSRDRSGEWEVVLMNLSYPHNWLVFDKPIQYLIMSPSTSIPILLRENTKEVHLSLAGRSQLDNWRVTKSSTIKTGNYTIRELIDDITLELLTAFLTSLIALGFNFNKQRVDLTLSVKFAFVCSAECSILHILGFGKQSRIGSFTTYHKFGYDLMVFNKNERVDALLPPLIKRITSMWVNINIIELLAVGDIQAQFL